MQGQDNHLGQSQIGVGEHPIIASMAQARCPNRVHQHAGSETPGLWLTDERKACYQACCRNPRSIPSVLMHHTSIPCIETVVFKFGTQFLWRFLKNTAATMAYFAFLFLMFWPMVASSFPDRNLVHAREPLITQAPQINDHPLLARGDVSTCGFVSGDVSMSPSSPSLSRLFRLTCTTTLS